MEFSDLRNNFDKSRLLEKNLPDNPLKLLEVWLTDALNLNIPEFNAMVLSTLNHNKPSSRVVLLKEINKNDKLVFFTNYTSRKGAEISSNNFVAVNFFWNSLERQIRIEGKVSKTPRKVSSAYFNSRPVESRAGAIVSQQSKIINDIEKLRKEAKELLSRGIDLSVPVDWGGYQISPVYFEFWQGGTDRLHDRIVFKKNRNSWRIYRLAP